MLSFPSPKSFCDDFNWDKRLAWNGLAGASFGWTIFANFDQNGKSKLRLGSLSKHWYFNIWY